MKKLLLWVRSNLLTIALLVVIAFLLTNKPSTPPLSRSDTAAISGEVNAKMSFAPSFESTPVPAVSQDRLVVKDTTLSLQVKNVRISLNDIDKISVTAGGYLVDSNLSVPEGAASGTVTIRVPAEKRTEVLNSLKNLAVKVVSEYVQGTDVTDQYQNLEEQLRLVNISKSKFEQILASAVRVSDILEVQRELINLQSQIDSIKGRQKYLEQTSKLTKITVYLSTDEFALPFTPDQPWRPEVIFKQAVRSLVGMCRDIASALIWAIVYLPLWGGLLLIAWLLRKKFQ